MTFSDFNTEGLVPIAQGSYLNVKQRLNRVGMGVPLSCPSDRCAVTHRPYTRLSPSSKRHDHLIPVEGNPLLAASQPVLHLNGSIGFVFPIQLSNIGLQHAALAPTPEG